MIARPARGRHAVQAWRSDEPRDRGTAPPTLRQLRPAEQRLIQLSRELGFGAIAGVRVSGGEVVAGATVRIQHMYRLGKPDRPWAAPPVGRDFQLNRAQRDLIEHLRGITDATVNISIQDGLPIAVVIERDAAV